jgi:nucleotide-binding universal stress UspA family protein
VRDGMSNFKKILVALDGSANSFRGLDRAIYLARQFHTTVTGLHVVPMVKPHTSDPITSMEKLFLENAAKFMKNAKRKAAPKTPTFLLSSTIQSLIG